MMMDLHPQYITDDNGEKMSVILSMKVNIQAFPITLIYDKDKNLKFSEVEYTSTFGLYL
ncbi:MAG: hypothetical protein KGV43_01740 [Arcobacter sp.]|nr:hypothetical protein [Arcobacter sp.]